MDCLIDLHLHLDGSISMASARQLAVISGIELPDDDEILKNQLMCSTDCRNLNDYLNRFDLPGKLMQTKETIEMSAFNLCNELRDKGLIYAEIRFAPQKHCEIGLCQEEVVEAAIEGVKKSDFAAGLILCCMRDKVDNSLHNLETVRLTKKYLGQGVCACDLAGAEGLFGNENYAEIFAYARKLGVPFTIHSGEARGAESVKLAILYGANRIGHGIRAIEDDNIVQMLVDKKIPIEVCPTSNINTCVYECISDMPIMKLVNKGVIVTINSDNMSVSNTDVKRELEIVKEEFNLTEDEKISFLINAADAAFVCEEKRKELKEKIFGIK